MERGRILFDILKKSCASCQKAETEIKQIQFLPLLPNIMIITRTILEIYDAAMSMERFSLTFSFLG